MMSFIPPMLLDSRDDPFDSKDFIYEPKSNGVRLELISSSRDINLITRHGNNVTTSLPEISSLNMDEGLTLDGEIVCYDPNNPLKEDFEAVMSRIMNKREMSISAAVKKTPCTLIVFDILKYKGKSIMHLPLLERKEILERAVKDQSHLTKVIYLPEFGNVLFDVIKAHQLEGMVAKRKDSLYQKGKRPKHIWYKIINWQYSECVITGYRKGDIGWYLGIENTEKIVRVGMVEFGISPKQKKEFYNIVKGLKTGENERSVWIKPVLHCRVKHRGFLKSGNIMTPVFVDFIY